MKDEIEKKQVLVDDLQDSGQWLVEHCKQDPKVVTDVQSKIANVRDNLDKLLSKIQTRQARLDKVLFQSQEFNLGFEVFMEKLLFIEEAVAKQRPVSAVYETVKKQIMENKVYLSMVHDIHKCWRMF